MRYYFLLLLLLFSCGSAKRSRVANQDNVAATNSNIESSRQDEPKIHGVYHESRTIKFELIHTRLDISFDWHNSLLHGNATVSCRPKFYPQNQLLLDAKGMIIHDVQWMNQALKYQYNGEELKIELPKTFERKDTLVVTIRYTAQPDLRPGGGNPAISGDKGLYFINPRGENKSIMPQIWTQGQTESNSVWFPTIDAPNQKMSQDIYITVDKKYKTLSNGILVESKETMNNQRMDHWQQKLPHAPYLTMLAVGEFEVVVDSWTRSDGKNIPVHYYVEPEWRDEAKAIFGNTPEMLSYFSKITGYENPWDKYHQIIVRDFVSGAMENTGAVIFGDMLYSTQGDLVDQNWDDIIAHELAHHWFGNLVTCESWSNLPLNESFATYFEVLWDEYKNGKDFADYHLQTDKQTYFRTVQNETRHHNVIWFDYDNKEQMFDGHSYSKGACILHMLRKYLGDEAFFEGIKYFLHKHQFNTVEAHDLRLAFETVTGLDLNWFFNQWFFAKGHPVLEVQHSVEADELTVFIYQKQDLGEFPLYRLPTKIRIWDNAGMRDEPIEIINERHEFSFKIHGTLNNFLVDPDYELLAIWLNTKDNEFLIHQFNNASHYMSIKNALSLLAHHDAVKYADIILSGLEDSFFAVRLEAIDQCNRIKKSHKEQVIEGIINIIKHDDDSRVRSSALAFISEQFPNLPELKKIVEQVISNDPSNICKSKAFDMLARLDLKKGFDYAKNLEKEKSGTILIAVADFYAENGEEQHFSFFERLFQRNYLKGQERMEAMIHFAKYLKNNKSSEIRANGLALLYHFHTKSGNELLVYNYVINQLLFVMRDDVNELNKQIAAYEQARDFVWAQRLEKEKTALQELIRLYSEK
jgi:aminopeptidase N